MSDKELAKTYDPKAIETGWYERWETSGAFACDPESPAQPYTIMMPPPNVTGSLHMGHALTFTLQDLLIRFTLEEKLGMISPNPTLGDTCVGSTWNGTSLGNSSFLKQA